MNGSLLVRLCMNEFEVTVDEIKRYEMKWTAPQKEGEGDIYDGRKTSTSDIHTQEEDVSIYELIFIEKTHVPLYIDPDTIRLPSPHSHISCSP